MAGAIMPAAMEEAVGAPGSMTVTAWPRAASSAAVQRPSTPAPITITSGDEATGDQIDRPQSECKPRSLLGGDGGSAGTADTGGESRMLIPQRHGQTIAKLGIKIGDQGGFLGPDVGVDVEQDRQIRVGQGQS